MPLTRNENGDKPQEDNNKSKKKSNNLEKAKKASPHLKLYPIATDVTAPRLRGCTYIQTECKY